MTLSIGILLGVMTKKHKKGLSRLRQYRQKLYKQNKNKIKIYQIPTKIIFSIIFIILLMIFLEWFHHQYRVEMQGLIIAETNDQIINQYKKQKINDMKIKGIDYTIMNEGVENSLLMKQQLTKNRKVVYYLQGILLFCIFILFSMLNLKSIVLNKLQKHIIITKYTLTTKLTQKYLIKQKDSIQIWTIGQDRFTYTNYYYSIRVIDKQTNDNYQIIEKSNLYDARITAITFGVSFDIDYSVKVVDKIVRNN